MVDLLALGDSHLDALKFAADLGMLKVNRYSFSIVPGATVVGLRNPNSLTDAINIFKAALADQSKDSCVITHLGEVDCGFVIWWRAKEYGENIDTQFRESIRAYELFLKEILEMGFSKICIAGASLPTIKDQVDFGEVANKRADVKVALSARTELTLSYNRELKALADELGIGYFDITDAVLDQSSHVIHDFYRNPNHGDHHLDMQKTVGVWALMCNAFVSKQS